MIDNVFVFFSRSANNKTTQTHTLITHKGRALREPGKAKQSKADRHHGSRRKTIKNKTKQKQKKQRQAQAQEQKKTLLSKTNQSHSVTPKKKQ